MLRKYPLSEKGVKEFLGALPRLGYAETSCLRPPPRTGNCFLPRYQEYPIARSTPSRLPTVVQKDRRRTQCSEIFVDRGIFHAGCFGNTTVCGLLGWRRWVSSTRFCPPMVSRVHTWRRRPHITLWKGPRWTPTTSPKWGSGRPERRSGTMRSLAWTGMGNCRGVAAETDDDGGSKVEKRWDKTTEHSQYSKDEAKLLGQLQGSEGRL
jgi:hypothetical protein